MKLSKIAAAGILSASLLLPIQNGAEASTDCQVDASDKNEINQLLTEKAKEYRIPAEILKAIAYEETGWEQSKIGYDPNGRTHGLGIMQVTVDRLDSNSTDEERKEVNRLKTDICYNVERGLKVLNEKWELQRFDPEVGGIPLMNQMERNIIENWYFPVMAYNSMASGNSPIKKDGTRNYYPDKQEGAYQEEIFHRIELSSLLEEFELEEFPFKKSDFWNSKNVFDFYTKSFEAEDESKLTSSSLNFTANDIAIVTKSANFHKNSLGDKNPIKLEPGTLVRIIDGKHHVKDVMSKGFPANHWVRYQVEVLTKDLKDTYHVASSYLQPVTSRISGASRVATAAEISKQGWFRKLNDDPLAKDPVRATNKVIIASGRDFPDALAGTTLAKAENAPILLYDNENPEKSITTINQEIKRLGAQAVIILGGDKAVPENIEKQIKTPVEKRLAGKDRYQTALAITNHFSRMKSSDKAIVATGENFADALAIAPYAAKNGIPILLTAPGSIEKDALTVLKSKQDIIIVGGNNAVSEAVEKDIKSHVPNADLKRIKGKDRYETAGNIIDQLNMESHHAFVASGENFPDALAGAVLAAKHHDPILLSKSNELDSSVKTTIKTMGISQFTLLGGEGALSQDLNREVSNQALSSR